MNILSAPFELTQFARFTDWIDTTPLGAYIIAGERVWFDKISADIFGYKAIQLQLPRIDFLRESRIPWRICAAEQGGDLQCLSESLPIASQSLDLLVLPHVLDFATHPREVLREAERVLVPGGRLLITGFNPWSLWAYRRLGRCDAWTSNWLSLPRLKDWLFLMGFENRQGSYFSYTFPLQNTKWLKKDKWFNRAGDRWWPAAGSIYCLDMIKRVYGVKILTVEWNNNIAANTAIVKDTSWKTNKAL